MQLFVKSSTVLCDSYRKLALPHSDTRWSTSKTAQWVSCFAKSTLAFCAISYMNYFITVQIMQTTCPFCWCIASRISNELLINCFFVVIIWNRCKIQKGPHFFPFSMRKSKELRSQAPLSGKKISALHFPGCHGNQAFKRILMRSMWRCGRRQGWEGKKKKHY